MKRGDISKLEVIGGLLVLIGIFAIFYSLFEGRYNQIFWFCYFGLILSGIGILSRRGSLVLSQLNILAIPSIFWSFDFLYRLVFNERLFGITDYIFEGRDLIGNLISLQHLFTLPLIFYSLYLIKFKENKIWRVSFIEAIGIYVIARVFTNAGENVDCAFRPCGFSFEFGVYYPIVWMAVMLIMVYVSEKIIIRLLK